MDGLWRCAKYAFAPNFLKYCGPDKNKELAGYISYRQADSGLKQLLVDFAAMHPYLKLIARENGIGDEFSDEVVGAYWLGNKLLDKVTMKSFFTHTRKRLPPAELKWFELKLPQGAKPNHAFHVFNFMKRSGHLAVSHTVSTMDSCRISSGRVVSPGKVATDRLVYRAGKLQLAPAVKRFYNLTDGFRVGDLISLHWDWACEKINQKQEVGLKRYTRLAMQLANATL